jgi:hypothetical protein
MILVKPRATHDAAETLSGPRAGRFTMESYTRRSLGVAHRRYDHLWERIGAHLPWVATQQISTHWLRHTTLTWVERNFGYATARPYAGHTDSDNAATTTYVRADIQEVAGALAAHQ